MVSVVSSTGTTITSTDSTSSSTNTNGTSSTDSPSAPSAASASQSLLQLSGLSSGVDTSSMIKELMAAAGVPRDQIYQQQEWVEWQQDAYRNINTAMNTFLTAEQNLQYQSTFNPYKATSSDTTDFSVSTGANVLQGTYQVQVDQVASAATLVSSGNVKNASGTDAVSTDTVGQAGTFTITYPSGSSTQTKSISVKSTDTFQTIASDITNANIGLTASFDNSTHRFVLSSTSTGAAQNYSISDSSGNIGNVIANGGQASTTTSTNTANFYGTDADVFITAPGSTSKTEVKQSTNNISALGLNLTVMNQTKDASGNFINANVNVQVDTDSVYNSISNFVSSYNTLIDTINTQLNSKRDYNYPPLTQSQKSAMSDTQISLWEAKAKSGVLENDPTLQNILDQLQNSVNDPVTGVTGLSSGQNTLASIGIGTEFITSSGTLVTDPGNTGHLQIDETTLKTAIANNPTQVMELFTTSDSKTTPNDNEGIGQRLYNVANNAITQLVKQAGTPGGVYNDGSYLGQQVSDLSQQLSDWSDRLSQLQTMYTNEFAQMETAMSQLNAQGSYLQQLG